MNVVGSQHLPVITEQEFYSHIEDDFQTRYGNPLCVLAANGRKYVCMTIELYERLKAQMEGIGDEPQF